VRLLKTALKTILIGLPICVLLLGIGMTVKYGWTMVKQTVLLADEVLVPYQPTHPGYRKTVGFWPTLPEPGTKLGTIAIPAVHISGVPVVQGTTWDLLALGAGHYAGSPLPGQPGNVVISGHRDTVFVNLQYIKPGDEVIFHSPYGAFVYRVVSIVIVPKTDPNIIVPTTHDQLTLTTCYPFYYIGFAPNRFVVRAVPVSEPRLASASSDRKSRSAQS
jgi:sortase A